ncbi:TPA: hypothetical protein ACOA6Q_002373 [Enterococcus faecium]|uniref:hypothetical protein n=1 Tax=Enterococcus faecium TaxID=1352 RepID=UPI0001B6FA7B|nr:hypothetical protein [Enterococcus faecium]EEV43653.1 conserved hypothetical protein [Enterococcus faecium 1,230,933]EKC6798535.1 hypothetical protein [Enterococcus faecium]EKY7854511.1 hypothetical protein [Enterococcus faecium]EKY7908926.1 hypothetical protein [Enterococcus faecium]EKY7920700.1 hypothetical protein [Enterococcus faecium]
MIKPDIDQFTLVLQTTGVFDFDEWRDWVAKSLISTFLIKSKMHKLFDNFGEADVKLPEGYTIGYSFINAPFYFCIAYHEAFSKMGVIVKYSAYAWHEYRKRYEAEFNEPIHLHTFLKMIDSDEYSFRLSRIDICYDFINEGIDIAKLKRSIEEKRTELRYGKY